MTTRNGCSTVQDPTADRTDEWWRLEPASEEATDRRFLAVVLGDHELLEHEFQALLAESWGSPPTGRALHPTPAGPSVPGSRPAASDRRLPTRPHHPGLGGWGRSRSPPCRRFDSRHLHDTSKGGDAQT